jgi:hypothetical protein
METSLRPLTLGEILDRMAELYRNNFVLFAGIFAPYAGVALVLNLLLIGLGMLLKNQHVAGATIWITLGTGAIEMLILFLLFGASVAAICRAVAWVHLGQPATIRGAYGAVLPRLGRYLWLMTITAFVVWTPFVLLYIGAFGVLGFYGKIFSATPGTPPPQPDPQTAIIIGIAMLAFFLLLLPVGAYTIFMSLRYALALPACVVENTKARPSLRRAIDLSKGARWRIFVLALLIGVIKIGLVGITQVFTIAGVIKNHGQLGPGLTALSQVIGFFTNTFLGPIYATGITLLYYDQRVRKEGFDIEWMMMAAGLTVPAPVPLIEAKSAEAEFVPQSLQTPATLPDEPHPEPHPPDEPPTHAEPVDSTEPPPSLDPSPHGPSDPEHSA